MIAVENKMYCIYVYLASLIANAARPRSKAVEAMPGSFQCQGHRFVSSRAPIPEIAATQKPLFCHQITFNNGLSGPVSPTQKVKVKLTNERS